MKNYLRALVFIIAAITVAAFASIVYSYGKPHVIELTYHMHLYGRVPNYFECDNYDMPYYRLCHFQEWYVSLDMMRGGAYDYVAVDSPNQHSVGEYLAAWGTPIGEFVNEQDMYIYWKDEDGSFKYINVYAPYSYTKVPKLVGFSKYTGKFNVWQGLK